MPSWNIRVNGKEYGPFSDGEIRQYAMEGRIVPDTEMQVLPDGAWIQAKKIKGLKFPPPPPPVPVQEEKVEEALMHEVDDLFSRSSGSNAKYHHSDGREVPAPPRNEGNQRLPYGLSLLIGIVFLLTAGVIGLNGLLFLGVSTQAESAPQQGAIGAQFGATFVGFYTLARCIEKLFKGLSGVV